MHFLEHNTILTSCFYLHSLKDFKEFAEAVDSVRDKGVAVAVASQEDIDAANKEHSNFFEVKKAL